MCGSSPPTPSSLPVWTTGGCLHGGVVGWIHRPLRMVSVWVATSMTYKVGFAVLGIRNQNGKKEEGNKDKMRIYK